MSGGVQNPIGFINLPQFDLLFFGGNWGSALPSPPFCGGFAPRMPHLSGRASPGDAQLPLSGKADLSSLRTFGILAYLESGGMAKRDPSREDCVVLP